MTQQDIYFYVDEKIQEAIKKNCNMPKIDKIYDVRIDLLTEKENDMLEEIICSHCNVKDYYIPNHYHGSNQGYILVLQH